MLTISADSAGDFKHRNFFRPRKSFSYLSFALSVERVVKDKFALENLVIAHTKLAEAVCDPAQTFARGMRVARMRIGRDRKSTRLNSSHLVISYAVFCLKKKWEARVSPWRGVAEVSEEEPRPVLQAGQELIAVSGQTGAQRPLSYNRPRHGLLPSSQPDK